MTLLIGLGIGVGGLWVLACVYFYRAQYGFMYLPSRAVPSLNKASVYDGQLVPIQVEENLITTSWYFPAQKGQGTILFFHGNNGNIETRTGWMQFALAQGWGLLMLGYRGYGGNPGTPRQAGLIQDGLAAYDWLIDQGIGADKIHLFGHSMGSAVACQVAIQRPCQSVGLMSPLSSAVDVGHDTFPFLPMSLMLKDTWRSIDVIDQIQAPLAIVYCDGDRTVRAKRSLQLYAAAKAPKELHLIPGLDHGQIALSGGPQVLVDFFARNA